MKKTTSVKQIILFLFITFPLLSIESQINKKKILKKYDEFGVTTREVVYIHMNKSVFFKNEILGFSAYVFDKSKKEPISITKNLYCTITNDKNEVIKGKLVKVEDGFTNNIFKIDTTFTPGKYKFKAYTNWMLNFNERNFYEHPFVVINSDTKKVVKKETSKNSYNVQITPEGGHLVSKINNVLGIIVKDKEGFGLANIKGKIVDSKNKSIAEFTLNKFGIARTSFTPLFNEKYNLVLNTKEGEVIKHIKGIENKGIVLSVADLRDKVGISFKINSETKRILKKKKYILAIHNGHQLKTSNVDFKDEMEILKTINYKELYSGINIFTLFDLEKNIPISERLFFNSSAISKIKTENIETSVRGDSILVKMRLNKNITQNQLQNISVSVLPSTTDSYRFNSNILSKLYLEPYLKGFIQDASYYFSNESFKTKYDLDNLLITQGWSSYNWGDIFKPQTYPNKFEQGINLVANINGESSEGFLAYPLKNNNTQIFKPTENDKAFIHTELFPEDNETYRVSILNKRNNTDKPSLYIQFYPTKIPRFSIDSYEIPYKKNYFDIDNSELSFINFDNAIMLNEIKIKSNKSEDRQKKIRNNSRGTVDFFTDDDTKGGNTLASYLTGRGFRANDYSGKLVIVNPNPNTPNNTIPLVILDNVPLSDFSFLQNFKMNIVDYIEIDKVGIGYGIRGGAGVIKIVTDPVKRMKYRYTKNEIASYKFPLTFNSPKKYYTPIYRNYDSKIFKKFGAIAWLPNLKVNENGYIIFKILNTNTNSSKLFIEGVLNNNFISETQIINTTNEVE